MGLLWRLHLFLRRFETRERLLDDEMLHVGDVDGIVFGMGRVGTAAYKKLNQRYGKRVVGVDFDQEQVQLHLDDGLYVIHGDASDYDFWQRIEVQEGLIKLVMLAMPSFEANLYAASQIRERSPDVINAAIVAFDDQIETLKEAGVSLVYNIHKEAGIGFADHVCAQVKALSDAELSTT